MKLKERYPLKDFNYIIRFFKEDLDNGVFYSRSGSVKLQLITDRESDDSAILLGERPTNGVLYKIGRWKISELESQKEGQ